MADIADKSDDKLTARREMILGAVDDLVTNFIYYDRKEDEELGRDEIEGAIAAGEITAKEISDAFADHLSRGLP